MWSIPSSIGGYLTAPAAINSFTISVCPPLEAQYKGVLPLESELAILTSALAAISSLTTSVCSFAEAICQAK